jgi:hypothetical protein
MNYAFLAGILLVLIFFSIGVRIHRDPGEMDRRLRYRTASSRRNEETWYSANVFAGKCLMLFASSMLIVLILLESAIDSQQQIIKLLGTYFLLGFLATYFLTERHLKKTYFRDGKRRPGSF